MAASPGSASTSPTRSARPPEEERTDYRFYGRRRGRPLRPGRQHLVETMLPSLAVPAGDGVLDPAALFERPPAAVWLEIGFGGGEHLAWQAAHHPDIGIIGAEPFLNGVGSLVSHVARDRLRNVRIWPEDVRPLLGRLPSASLDRVFVLFPDPWRKSRHAARRLVSRPLLDRLAELMREGAELRLASDDVTYQRWMLQEIHAHPAFAWRVEGPADWRTRPADWPETRYEAKARAAGRTPIFLRLVRGPR